jgi:hypothetical protein
MLVKSKEIFKVVRWDGNDLKKFKESVGFPLSVYISDPCTNQIEIHSYDDSEKCFVLKPGDFAIFDAAGGSCSDIVRVCSEKELGLLYEEIKDSIKEESTKC